MNRAPLRSTLFASVRRIAPLAWPVFIGQIAVLAFSTVDTVMVARAGALDLAALAVGGAAYISVFVGLMGVVLAVGPIAGQLFGAGDLHGSGRQLQQAMWLALALSVAGCTLLAFPEPFLGLARAQPEVEAKVRAHLGALAFALPPALLFTAFRGFNTAVSRPKIVMALQLGALVLKVPLTALLVFGARLATPFGILDLPAGGAPGCGRATAVVMIGQLLAACVVLRRDPFYAAFGLQTIVASDGEGPAGAGFRAGAGRGRRAGWSQAWWTGRWMGRRIASPTGRRRLPRPDRASLAALLRLGLPMGLSIGIEVTGFTFMALFISRLGATPVAGHQIAVNMVSMMFMLPLAIANASATLVAQRIGAADAGDARRLGWHGLQIGVLIAAAVGGAVFLLRGTIVGLYSRDPTVVAAAVPLLAWVGVFHVADAAQTVASFVLRAYRIATVPVVIYAVAIWGVGLGGGYLLAFDATGHGPPALRGATGFWAAATAGLTLAGFGMSGFLGWRLRREPTPASTDSAATSPSSATSAPPSALRRSGRT